MIRVLSLDDHHMFSMGLQQAITSISKDIHVTICADPDEASDLIANSHDLDLLILDLNMPTIDGISFMKQINAKNNFIPVAILSAMEDLHLFQEALSLGASGIIPKTTMPMQLVEAIRHICSGNIYLPETIKKGLDTLPKFSKHNTGSMLSKRQFEIVKCLQKGHSNKDIANILYISELTVKSHLRSIFKLLGVRNRTECVKKAERFDII